MGVISDAAESPGDLMKRLSALERKVAALSTARRAEATAIGKGGLRVKGGRILIQNAAGETTMTLSTDGLSLEGLLAVLGEINVSGGGSVVVRDGGGVLVDDGGDITASGGGQVAVRDGGGVLVDDGGDITARGGRFLAEEPDGADVFRVGTDPAEIFLRKDLISSLVEEIVEELLTSPAGEELAAFVFAQRVHGDYVAAQQTTSSPTYGNLSTVGPTVADVPISTSGKAMVWLSALIEANCAAPSGGGVTVSADMGFEISGATSRSPGANGQFLMQSNFDAAEETSNTARMGIAAVVDGLNEGLHTFTAKYRRVQGTAPVPFAERTMVVMGL